MIEHDQIFNIPIICTVQLTMYSIAIQLVILGSECFIRECLGCSPICWHNTPACYVSMDV